MSKVFGHCFCNSIRFEVDGPEIFACFCYCESCQRAAGAPVVAWATYSKSGFRVTKGDMAWRESSPGVTRGHCASCGTSVTYEHTKRPGEIDITLNALDDPTGPRLRAHIWTEDKLAWMQIGDRLPVYRKQVENQPQ